MFVMYQKSGSLARATYCIFESDSPQLDLISCPCMKVLMNWFVKMVVQKATPDENHWSAASQLSPWEAPRSVTFCSHKVALFLPSPNHQCKQEVKNKHLCRRRLQTDGYMDLEVCMVLWQFYKTVLLEYGMKKSLENWLKKNIGPE